MKRIRATWLRASTAVFGVLLLVPSSSLAAVGGKGGSPTNNDGIKLLDGIQKFAQSGAMKIILVFMIIASLPALLLKSTRVIAIILATVAFAVWVVSGDALDVIENVTKSVSSGV